MVNGCNLEGNRSCQFYSCHDFHSNLSFSRQSLPFTSLQKMLEVSLVFYITYSLINEKHLFTLIRVILITEAKTGLYFLENQLLIITS